VDKRNSAKFICAIDCCRDRLGSPTAGVDAVLVQRRPI
jgi:hypothetical protein